ncbi:MAG: response regulator, partial [Chlorobia bacterium]|nr:response regulator [Fimbriimonadaceae bacterium]
FDPFYTTKPVGEGTGLGLSVVYGIVLRHKGAITVNSEVGTGTVFHVYFPVVDAPATVAEGGAAVSQKGGGERILYVDDDEALVYMLTRILRRLNYEVVGFTNPKEALEVFKANPDHFDLVITDMSMPYMDGATLVHELQAIRPLLPIVLVTGYVQPKDLETARNLGVNQLILKPNTVAEMADALHRIFAELPKRAIPAST